MTVHITKATREVLLEYYDEGDDRPTWEISRVPSYWAYKSDFGNNFIDATQAGAPKVIISGNFGNDTIIGSSVGNEVIDAGGGNDAILFLF